jgi:hypothetical protein
MDPIRVDEIEPGQYSLCLEAGTTDVDHVIQELGHEPNGPFWEGIVELLVTTEAPTLRGRFEPDPEGGAFYAYSSDRSALDDLAVRLETIASDERRLRELVRFAETTGFEFDD